MAFIPSTALPARQSPLPHSSFRPIRACTPSQPPSQPPSAAARAAAHSLAVSRQAESLKTSLVAGIATAAAAAFSAEVAASLAYALSDAADARTAAAAARGALSGTRESAARGRAEIAAVAAREAEKVALLERRVAFLTNQIHERGRESREEGGGRLVEDNVDVPPCQCASDARLCLSSLLVYPGLFERGDEGGEAAFSSALVRFLESVIGGVENDVESAAAYASLWRVIVTGRRGWHGEIVHAAITAAEPELLAAAQVSPETRRALVGDLRNLQALFVTEAEEVASWVGTSSVAAGGAAPMALPKNAFVGVGEDVDEDGSDEYGKLGKMLREAKDWGDEAVVTAILENAMFGPSQASSLADRYWGLRWNAGTKCLEGVLSGQDVANMPQNKFIGVEHIRAKLIEQVEFLMAGLPVSNVYLWGPPGAGKSTAVFNCISEFGESGVRIIEVDKAGIADLPLILNLIEKLPQKFITFCDDLSFDFSEGETMRVAKTALEGSLRKNPENTMCVVTSNRRYPVGSRDTDATGEMMAFSNRFGVILAFPRMARDAYLEIVYALCDSKGIVMTRDELSELALAWALGQDGNASNSLSGRTARQFADHVSSVQALAALKGIEPGNYLASSGKKGANAVPANSMWASDSEGAAFIQR